MGSIFDVLINFVTKSSGDGAAVTTSALADIEARVRSSNEFLETQTALLVKQKAAAKELAAEYKDLAKKYKDYENFSPAAKSRMGQQNPEYKKYQDMQKAVNGLNKEITTQTKVVNDAKVAQKELGKELRTVKEKEDDVATATQKANALLTRQSVLLSRMASNLTRFGTGAMIGGTAIVGGIVAEANRYAKEAGMATEATRKWNAQLINLQSSRTKIDQTLVREALPLLETAAKVAGIASSFISSHPNIVQAALTVGASLVTIGALAKALAIPIKLVSDRLYYIAQLGQIKALEANTAALTGRSILGGLGKAAVVGGTAAAVGTGIALGAVVAGAAYVANKMSGGYQGGLGRGSGPRGFDPALKQIEYQEKLSASTNKASTSLDKLSTSASKASGANAPYPDVKQGSFGFQMNALAGISNAPQATAWAEQQVLALRVVDASITDLNANYTASLQSITADFLKNEKKAEAERADQRAKILRDSGIEIQRIEQDSQRRLAKMALDHEDKMYSLTLQRDALGIVQEQRDYARAQDEEESNTTLEIKKRRADIALKLSDMTKQYKAERALAVQQYQAQLNTEKAKYEAQHSVLVAQKNDLLRYLTDERAYRNAYNAAILADLVMYAAAWRATLASALTPTQINLPYSGYPIPDYANHADGGYADYGLHLLGDNPLGGRGPREFVMSGRTTRAAESVLGGALNQQNLIAALSGAGGGLHVVDNSRYATTISASDRRAMRQGAVADTLKIVTAAKKR